LKSFNRFRDDFTLDGAIEWSEILVAIFGVLILGGAIAALFARETKYQRLAAERFDVETSSMPAPTPAAIGIVSMNVTGAIGDDGDVRTRSTITVRNSGATPVQTLAFSINPMLTVRASASESRATTRSEEHTSELQSQS